MNENDDVMNFDDEPNINPEDSYTEPEIPESNNQNSDKNNGSLQASSQENSTVEQGINDYAGYEGFEAMDSSEMSGSDLNEGSYQQSEAGPDNHDVNNTSNNADYEESQAKKILDTKPSEKSESKANKNNGLFLNRQRLLLIFAGIFVAFILFFAFVFPMISSKKKKEKESEVDKNGRQYIPQMLNNEVEQPNTNNFENGNSATSNYYVEESVEEKYPPIVQEQPKNVAPVSVSGSSTSTTEIPLTNRNEQQKQPQRLALEKVTSPVESQTQKSSSKYPSVIPQGYNTGYNSGYSGTNTQATGGSSSYMPQSLSSNIDKVLAQQSGGNLASSYIQQNNQSAKQAFLNKNGIGGNYQWNAEYSLWKGTVISAVLDTGINTDLPGQVMAHVTKSVYSSQNGEYLLIPQGSRLFGEYNSDISYGQSRIQVVWNTLIRPDGLEVNLGSMNGIDAYGVSGYAGWKSEHPFEYVKAFGLIAMYSILDTKAMNLIDAQNNTYAQNALTDVYSETKKLNNKIVDRALDIQPRITIKSGTKVNLITNVTIDLPPLEPYEVEEKYVRY